MITHAAWARVPTRCEKRGRSFRTWALPLLATVASVPGMAKPSCPPMTMEGLEALSRREGPLRLVFFASWCSTCRATLEAKHTENTVLVAAFDKQSAAEKALAAFGVSTRCVTSQGIAEALEVNSFPTQKTWQAPPLTEKSARGL